MLKDLTVFSRICIAILGMALFFSSCNSYEKALWDAVDRQEVGNVERLLKRGADVHQASTDQEMTLLELASKKGNPDIVKLLLENGADANVVKGNETALWLAMRNGNEEAAIVLVEAGALMDGPVIQDFSPFYFAVMQDFEALAMKMLAHKADIYAPGPAGSPVHEAAENGNVRLLRLLAINGADMNRFNSEGETPIFLALDAGKYETAEWLVGNGANLKQTNILGNTVLSDMVEKNDTTALKFLCGLNVAPNSRNLIGESALHRAAALGHLGAAKILVENCKAELNLRDNLGLSPAGLAFREGHAELVDYLTSMGGRLR